MSGQSINTRSGGHAARTHIRDVVADPNGNREQRRAARKLGITGSHDGDPSCVCESSGRHPHRHMPAGGAS